MVAAVVRLRLSTTSVGLRAHLAEIVGPVGPLLVQEARPALEVGLGELADHADREVDGVVEAEAERRVEHVLRCCVLVEVAVPLGHRLVAEAVEADDLDVRHPREQAPRLAAVGVRELAVVLGRNPWRAVE